MDMWPALECEKCKLDRKQGKIPKSNEQKIAKQLPMDSKDEENMPSTSGMDTQGQQQNLQSSGAEKSKSDHESSNMDQAQSESNGGKDKSPAESSGGKDQAQSESSGGKEQPPAESSGGASATVENPGGKDQAQSESSDGKDQAQPESSGGKDQSAAESSGGKKTGAPATVESSLNTQPHSIPPVTKELTGRKDIAHRTITLECRLSHMVPTIRWFYMGYQIQECTHYQQVTELVDGEARVSLRLAKLMPVDMGIYTCVAYTENNQFVSTSCNLTASGKPVHMNEYLKSCKKCILRKAARLDKYEAMVKKRRKLMMERKEEEEDDVSAQPLPPVINRPLPATSNLPLPVVINQPLLVVTNRPLPVVTNRPLPVVTNQPLPAVANQNKMQTNNHGHTGKLEKASGKSKGQRGYVNLRDADTFHEDKNLVEARKKREHLILNTNANLRRKVKKYQQIVRRQNENFEKQREGKIPNKNKRHRSTQTTLKDKDPVAELKKLESRYKEIHAKYYSVNGRYGSAVKEVTKLQNNMKSMQEKHTETVKQLKDRIAELEGAVQRKDGSSIRRQLQSRGKDPSAYAGFIQYMTDD